MTQCCIDLLLGLASGMSLTMRRYSPPEISFITIREFPDFFFLCIGAFAPVVLLSLFALQLCDACKFKVVTPVEIENLLLA